MTGAAMGRLSVCCMSSGRDPARLAAILAPFGSVADEIVVAVEEPRSVATHDAVAHVADRVLSFPPCEPADRPIPWLFGLCTGKWILNIDDDEVASPRLIEMLPGIVARPDITHGWIARRWLYPTTDSYLAEAPWGTEFQLRLLLADTRFLQFSDLFHRPVVAHGPGLFIDAPLWHLDTAVNPVARRRVKADAYELARPGMKIGGRAHNHALYVPELVPDVTVAAVPRVDQAAIDAALAGDWAATREARALFAYTSIVDVDHAWPGCPHADTLHRGRIAVAAIPAAMRAGVQETIDAYVTNESEVTWRWGKDARPEIRLGYRWSLDGEPVDEPTALRTALPADLPPGTTQFVPVHVVPPGRAGTYSLQLDIVHEGVAEFGSTVPVELEVRERELLAVVGPPASVTETLTRLAPAPDVEAVVVLGNDGDRPAYGDRHSVSGLRSPLLAGLQHSGRLSRGARLSWRSLGIVWKAWRYGRTGSTHDARLAGLFDLLARSRALVVAGRDWPADAAHGREWWRLVTTILVARTIDVPVVVTSAAVPNGDGIRAALPRWLIAHFSSRIDEEPPPRQLPVREDQPVLATRPTPVTVAGESGDSVAALRDAARGRRRPAPFPDRRLP
jgi:hypothetical protein